MTERAKPVRATITGELAEQYEQELFEKNLTERDLIEEALRNYFSEQEKTRVRSS
jgi:hypothetical protein